MPNYGAPWDSDESQGYGDDYSEADFFGGSGYWENEQNRIYRPIWKPGDPEVGYFSPTMEERRQYRDNASFLATGMAPLVAGVATGYGASGYDAAYEPAHFKWEPSGDYKPQSRVVMGVWGPSKSGLGMNPVIGGAIITPSVTVFSRKADQEYDESGRPLDPGSVSYTHLTLPTSDLV